MSRLIKAEISLSATVTLLVANRYVSDASGQWERKLVHVSPLRRSVSLEKRYERSGITLTVDDVDGEIRLLMDLAHMLFGRAVTLYVYKPNGVTLSDTITLTIRAWRRENDNIVFECAQEPIGIEAPPVDEERFINLTDFPEAAPEAVGQPVLYPAGVCYAKWGWQMAYKVINQNVGAGTNRKYLLTWSDPAGDPRILSIQSVISNGSTVPSGDYSFTRDANGWEYLEWNNSKGRIRCRVNLTAAVVPGTAGGNPVVALLDVLTRAGMTLVDDDDLEASFDTSGIEAIRTLTQLYSTSEYLEVWGRSFNIFWRLDSVGAVHIKRFDWGGGMWDQDANIPERSWIDFHEKADMDVFANRIRARYGFANGEWQYTALHINTLALYGASDIPVTTFPKERLEDYELADYDTMGGDDPYARLRFFERVRYTASGSIPLGIYESLGLGLLKTAYTDHYNQIRKSNISINGWIYIIMEENIDWMNETVSLTLWNTQIPGP